MPRFTGSPRPRERASAAALTTSELLEALWGRGQEMSRRAGASPSQLRALRVTGSHQGTDIRRLAACLGSREPAVTGLRDRLGARGPAERCPGVTSSW
ncbi:hypothetical protein [Streptomyces decoyicus]|uniref:hypothetical protein n=1 Tax=Streptomyces decoyicus TaxID=249567 RepID=UPI00339E022B